MTHAITYRLDGRLGNQLQLYACARTLALRYGWRFVYSPLALHRDLNLSALYPRGAASLVERLLARLGRRTVLLNNHRWDSTFNARGAVTDEFLEASPRLYVLTWGGIFTDISEFLPTLRTELVPAHLASLPRRDSIGVHIRRDDSRFKMPIAYYASAIRMAIAGGCEPVADLYSDGDHERLASELRGALPEVRVEVERGAIVDDMVGLSRYSHLVISMSWFSYWSAYLSEPDTHVYCPADFRYHPGWTAVSYDGPPPGR